MRDTSGSSWYTTFDLKKDVYWSSLGENLRWIMGMQTYHPRDPQAFPNSPRSSDSHWWPSIPADSWKRKAGRDGQRSISLPPSSISSFVAKATNTLEHVCVCVCVRPCYFDFLWVSRSHFQSRNLSQVLGGANPSCFTIPIDANMYIACRKPGSSRYAKAQILHTWKIQVCSWCVFIIFIKTISHHQHPHPWTVTCWKKGWENDPFPLWDFLAFQGLPNRNLT